MQDFGYPRRDPDAAPDSDYAGFDFRLTKLNEFNGNFANAEMVRAFITSDEYRRRSGQVGRGLLLVREAPAGCARRSFFFGV